MSDTLTYGAIVCILGSMLLLAAFLVGLGVRAIARERRRPAAWEPARVRLGARWERVWGRPALVFEDRGLRCTAGIAVGRTNGSFTMVEVIAGPTPAPGHPLAKVRTETLPAPAGWTLRREGPRVWASHRGLVLDPVELLRGVDAVLAAVGPR